MWYFYIVTSSTAHWNLLGAERFCCVKCPRIDLISYAILRKLHLESRNRGLRKLTWKREEPPWENDCDCTFYTAYKVQGMTYFCSICPCDNDIVYAGFKYVRTFVRLLRIMGKCTRHLFAYRRLSLYLMLRHEVQ